MRTNRPRPKHILWAVFFIAWGLMVIATPVSAAKAPAGKTYFVATMGLDDNDGGPFEVGVGCVAFGRAGGFFCERNEQCGTWERMVGAGQTSTQTAFRVEMQFEDDETGNPIFVDGIGRVDDRGPKHTIAVVFRSQEPVSGFKMNAGFVGKPTKWGRCTALVEDFENGGE